jgi:hypothetical protein
MKILKKSLLKIIPRPLVPSLLNFRILNFGYGHLASARSYSSVDAKGSPIPWYTYPALEYIRQLDFCNKSVFEYGAGNSTIFWANLSHSVMSVEDNKQWFDRISLKLPLNAQIILVSQQQEYIQSIHRPGCNFDVIIIDGEYRYECCQQAPTRLNDGGFIILDNADWYPKGAQVLRDADLIEVDFTGFSPINGYTSTTSFFFHRLFNFKPRIDCQPLHGTGSINHLFG